MGLQRVGHHGAPCPDSPPCFILPQGMVIFNIWNNFLFIRFLDFNALIVSGEQPRGSAIYIHDFRHSLSFFYLVCFCFPQYIWGERFFLFGWFTGCTGGTRNSGSIPGSGKFPGGGNGNPLQYSCVESSMDRGAWGATVHGVTKESDITEHKNRT